LPGDISDEQTLTLFNTGNTAGDSLVSGTSWINGTNSTIMNTDVTKYSATPGDSYVDKTSLDGIEQLLVNLPPQADTDTFWQLQANILDPLFSGSLTQTIDFTVTC